METKTRVIEAPHPVSVHAPYTVFLAGSIEMGAAKNWQGDLINRLSDHAVTFLNPRRKDWDSSWEQSKDNPKFKEQVEWELDNLRDAQLAVFYFDPDTKSPITLMELGFLAANSHDHPMIVCCPKGFWRKGNVDIICAKYGIEQVDTFDELIQYLNDHLPTEFSDSDDREGYF